MKTSTFTVNRETEKALNVTMTVEGLGEVTTWLPKSSATISDGTLTVKPAFWRHKEAELAATARQEEARRMNEGDVLVSGDVQEYEKSYGVAVTVYESMSEQSRRSRIFLPKSLSELTEGGVRTKGWMLRKAIERVKEQFETHVFRASSMEVEGYTVQAI